MGTITRAAYEDMVAEDSEWLEDLPRCLERDHARTIVEQSPAYLYGLLAVEEMLGIEPRGTVDERFSAAVEAIRVLRNSECRDRNHAGLDLLVGVPYRARDGRMRTWSAGDGTEGMGQDVAVVAHRLSGLVKGDPELDGTDAAHPAYWRGEADGVRGAVNRCREAMRGEHTGVVANPGLQALCNDLMSAHEASSRIEEAMVSLTETLDGVLSVHHQVLRRRLR